MAKTTRLTQTANPDFTVDAHWDNNKPADGDTIGTNVDVAGALANRPAAGTFDVDQNAAKSFHTNDFFDGATVRNVVATAGTVEVYQAITGTMAATGANLWMAASATVTGAITLNAGGILSTNGFTLTANGGIVLAGGKIDGTSASSIIDTTAITGTGEIDWGSGTLDILGRIEGTAITHTLCASGNSYTHDTATNLNLGYEGSDTDALAITCTANATLTGNLRCGVLTFSPGALTIAGGTYTIRCAGLTVDVITVLTGIGAISVYGNLVNSGSGGGALTHTGLFTQYGTGNLKWGFYGVNKPLAYAAAAGAAITLTGATYFKSAVIDPAAAMALGTNNFDIRGPVANCASLQGTWTATSGYVIIESWTANATNAGIINIGSVKLWMNPVTNNVTFTQSAPITCGALEVSHFTAAKVATLAMSAGSRLTANAVVLGAAALDKSGVLDLSAGGSHSIASLARGNAANLANALTLGPARLNVSGTITGTGIAVTCTGGRIDAQGTGRVTAVTATGPRLVVYRAIGATAGKQLRGWNVDSCVNVRHYPRRIIGARQGLVTP